MTLNVRLRVSLVSTVSCLMLDANSVFAQCTCPDLPYRPMSAVVTLGGCLSSDGRGAYMVGRQGDRHPVQAPPGSIGRLFDDSRTFAPIDKGLYRFSFLVTLSPKTKGEGKVASTGGQRLQGAPSSA